MLMYKTEILFYVAYPKNGHIYFEFYLFYSWLTVRKLINIYT